MTIGVVSDTHSRDLPQDLLEDLAKVDLIIHAGDFCTLQEYKIFTRLKETKAVYGNMDEPGVRQILPRKEIFEAESVRIGIFHGEGAPLGLLERVQSEFKGERVAVIVFGHSHHPWNQKIKGTLFFNPGSPNDKVFAPYCSYGILQIDGGQVTGKIIKLK